MPDARSVAVKSLPDPNPVCAMLFGGDAAWRLLLNVSEDEVTMSISVILAHPDRGSFNHAIADAVVEQIMKNGHDAAFHDLYREKFDPLLPREEIAENANVSQCVLDHCKEIAEAQGIVVIHPNWWGQPPAILKGWVDRVLRPGVAYRFLEGDSGEGIPQGLLKAETAIVFNTSNTEPEREKTVFGDPLDTIWRNCVFGLCGVSGFYRRTFGVVVTSSADQRRRWLDEARVCIDRFFPAQVEQDKHGPI